MVGGHHLRRDFLLMIEGLLLTVCRRLSIVKVLAGR